jgi:hypothetical protein
MRGVTIPLAALLTLVGATNVAIAWTTTELVDSGSGPLAVSGDGRFVTFNLSSRCHFCGVEYNGYVRDRRLATTSEACADADQDEADAISRDGRLVLCQIIPGESYSREIAHVVNLRTGADTVLGAPDAQCCFYDPAFDSAADALSATGRYVVFHSGDANVVPGDTNHRDDVFVFDTTTAKSVHVSLGPNGRQGNRDSIGTAVSGNGRFVVFYSAASNLADGDTDHKTNVFLRDRLHQTTELVSVATGGRQANGDSGNGLVSDVGRIVAFDSAATDLVPGDHKGKRDVFVRDRRAGGTTVRISLGRNGGEADGDSHVSSLSPDGRYVVLESDASNLVPGDTNGATDVFLYDRQARTTERVSVSRTGKQGNGPSSGGVISADDKVIAFTSSATNLVPGASGGVFVRVR